MIGPTFILSAFFSFFDLLWLDAFLRFFLDRGHADGKALGGDSLCFFLLLYSISPSFSPSKLMVSAVAGQLCA